MPVAYLDLPSLTSLIVVSSLECEVRAVSPGRKWSLLARLRCKPSNSHRQISRRLKQARKRRARRGPRHSLRRTVDTHIN